MHNNMKRSVLSLALSMGLLAGLATTASAAYFKDVEWHWAKSEIHELTEKNILEGYEDGRFRPNKLVNRAEFTTMLVKALGYRPNSRSHLSFNDVPRDHWATGAIYEAEKRRLVEGFPDREFRPSEYITRAQALSILAKVTMGENPDRNYTEMVLGNYRDGRFVPDWARIAVAKTIRDDVFKSTRKHTNQINPSQPVTRGEVAVLLQRMLKHNELARKPKIDIHHKWDEVISNRPVRINVPRKPERNKSTYTATVATALSSEFHTLGDKVTVILDEPLTTPEGWTAPPGSKIIGEVVEVEDASYFRNGKLKVDFFEVWTPEGKMFKINGSIATNDGFIHPHTTKTEALKRNINSYEGLKATIRSESSDINTHLLPEPVSASNIASDESSQTFLYNNKDNFVLVGVGDKMEIKLNGPVH